MSKLRVDCFCVSLDGYGAGPNQSVELPWGERGTELPAWAFPTQVFQQHLFGKEGGETGAENDLALRSFENVGAWIMGRNMFGPMRGAWPDESWKGWWGDNPVYHCDVFVLTHHPRAPLVMEGGTTFHFVTDGIHAARERAKAAAKGKDIRVGGGANVVRQYLQAGLIDEMHLAVAPVFLGAGEHLFDGLDLPALGFKTAERVATGRATHYVMKKEDR